MSLLHQPRLASAAAALAGALFLLGLTPEIRSLEQIDRQLAASVVGAPLSEMHGRGDAESPRYRQAYAAPKQIADARFLVVDDNDDGVLEGSPPTPSDLAVVISNIDKAGVRQVGVSYPLGWSAPDRISLMAMHLQLDQLKAAVLALPLSYGSAGEPVRQPFLRASLALKQVQGDVTALPVVNRVAISDPELGGDKTLAGFSQLLNEAPAGLKVPLLARWNDRIVLSQPLVMAVARMGIPFSEVTVTLGQSIKLGAKGPTVPITPRGEISQELQAQVQKQPLGYLFGGRISEDFWKIDSPVYIVDQRSTASTETLAWNEALLKTDAAIRRSPNAGKAQEFPRPDALVEMGVLFGMSLLTGGLVGVKRKPLAAVMAVLLTVGNFSVLAYLASHHLPMPQPLALVSVPVLGLIMSIFVRPRPIMDETVHGESWVEPPPVPVIPSIVPVPAVAEPSVTPPKRDRGGKAAKKSSSKKSASKSKSSRKSSQPPP